MMLDGCNANLQILRAFYLLLASFESLPAFVEVMVHIGDCETRLFLPIQQYNAKGIQAKCPLLRFRNRKVILAFEETLISELLDGLANGSIQRGYYFHQAGTNTLPYGNICFIRGSELLGSCNRPYMIAPEICDIRLLGQGRSLSQFLSLLVNSPIQVLLVLAYVILTSIRSLLVDNGIDFQAVLYIVGRQGLGKTTLAMRIAGIYEKAGSPVGIVQAGSTLAAVNALMANLRDQPIVIDDLCLSASRDTARKRVDLASKLIRQGTGSIPIMKRSGSSTVELPCEAGLIITAEFPLENLSDLTRCIIVPVNEPLDIPNELTPGLIGEAVRHYSLWFSEHDRKEIEMFRAAVDEAVSNSGFDTRIATNYACLKTAFYSLLCSLDELKFPKNQKEKVSAMLDKALDVALEQHKSMINQIKEHFPVGNLQFCILDGYKNGAFDLAKKIDKLSKHDGMIWKDDLCLRKEALIQFVRQQPGYHDWTSNRITRALKDINALVLQEEEAATIRLIKDCDVPRVYRIRMKILKETSEKY